MIARAAKDAAYKSMAEQGQRVLALAYARVDGTDVSKKSRQDVEQQLTFAGFIAFKCGSPMGFHGVFQRSFNGLYRCPMRFGCVFEVQEPGIATKTPQGGCHWAKQGQVAEARPGRIVCW